MTLKANPYFFNGQIDEVSVWRRALDPEEIRDLGYCPLTGTEPDLVGYWNFEDGSAGDLTRRGHGGSFVGDARVFSVQGADIIHAGCIPIRFTGVSRMPGGQIRLNLRGAIGRDCRIDVSADLQDWSPLIILPNATGVIEFTDPSAPGLGRRFYRAVHP